MKRILLIFSFLIILMHSALVAQDARFSQYFNQPLVMNPSLAGNGIEHIRISAIYRNQWAGFSTPFTTQGFSVDKVVNRIGIGAVITRNGGGEGTIKTLNLTGNLAYHHPLGAEKNHTLSAGLQVGVVNKSFDPSKLTFDNQYNPDQGYDPTQGSGEIFTSTSITRPDVNVGFFWQRGWLKKDIRFKPFAGVGFSHVTRPNETFIVEENRVEIKRTIYGGAGFMLNEKTELKPSMMHLSQGQFSETIYGTLINYQLDNKNQFQLGAFHRVNDAVIAYAGYQMNLLFVGMGYDINIGELSKTGKGTNAFEISLTYSPRPKRKKEPKEVEVKDVKKPIITEQVNAVVLTEVPNEVAQEVSVRKFVDSKTETPVAKIADAQPVATPEKVNTEIQKPVTETLPVINPVTIEVAPTIKNVVVKTNETPSTKATEIVTVVPSVKPEITESIPATQEIVNRPATGTAVEIIIPAVKVTPETPKPVDSDNDGIIDSEDRCPYIKGGKATGGCPDSDNDGLIDMDDDCPLESGPATNKGCPDPNVPAPKNNQELIKTYDHILFNSGSVKMTTDDIYDIVERAVDILYADKTTMVLLSGHTDSEGNDSFNMSLSQQRADIVKAYLIKQGIDESRIQTVAYGETMPVRDNLWKENMKQNRRVELNILRRK